MRLGLAIDTGLYLYQEELAVADTQARAISVLAAPHSVESVACGARRRKAVTVKAAAVDGLIGQSESHHSFPIHPRVSHLFELALKPMGVRMDANNVNCVRQHMYA